MLGLSLFCLLKFGFFQSHCVSIPLQIGAEPGKLGMISFEVRQPNSGFAPISLIASLIQTNLSTMTF